METRIKEFHEILHKGVIDFCLKKNRNQGWIANARSCNVGGIGNTLEDLLEIDENNLPIPNAAEWELKCQRKNTTSLTIVDPKI